jgi:hypothetical protein
VSRKGKTGPLEAGRGKYSPPANPGRVTSEALKRRDNGVLSGKTESLMRSADYRIPANKNQETPDILGQTLDSGYCRHLARNLDRPNPPDCNTSFPLTLPSTFAVNRRTATQQHRNTFLCRSTVIYCSTAAQQHRNTIFLTATLQHRSTKLPQDCSTARLQHCSTFICRNTAYWGCHAPSFLIEIQ